MKNKSFWKDIPYATRFAIGQFLYMFLLLVFIFAVTYAYPPMMFKRHDSDQSIQMFNEFWKGQAKGDGTDIVGMLLGLTSLPAAFLALIVFRKRNSSGQLDELNDKLKAQFLRTGAVILLLLLQALVAAEWIRLANGLGRLPACVFALMILIFNIVALLSLLDYDILLGVNKATATERKNRYQKWKEKPATESENRYQKWKEKPWLPLLLATLPHFGLYLIRFILSYGCVFSAIKNCWWHVAISAFLILCATAIMSVLQTVVFASDQLDAASREKRHISGAAIAVAAALLFVQCLMNITLGIFYAHTWLCIVQGIALVFACINFYYTIQTWPLFSLLRRPYLLKVCDNKIKEQKRVIDEINALSPDPVKTDSDKSQTEPPATDQATTDNADKSVHTIAGAVASYSRSSPWQAWAWQSLPLDARVTSIFSYGPVTWNKSNKDIVRLVVGQLGIPFRFGRKGRTNRYRFGSKTPGTADTCEASCSSHTAPCTDNRVRPSQ